MKIGQSSHNMYSNNILNFQSLILNAIRKKSGNLSYAPRICIYVIKNIYIKNTVKVKNKFWLIITDNRNKWIKNDIYIYIHIYIYIYIYIYILIDSETEWERKRERERMSEREWEIEREGVPHSKWFW